MWGVKQVTTGNTEIPHVNVATLITAMKKGKTSFGYNLWPMARAEREGEHLRVFHRLFIGSVETMKKKTFPNSVVAATFNTSGDIITTINEDGVTMRYGEAIGGTMLAERVYKLLKANIEGKEPVVALNGDDNYLPLYPMGPYAALVYIGLLHTDPAALSPYDVLARAQAFMTIANPEYRLSEIIGRDISYSFLKSTMDFVVGAL